MKIVRYLLVLALLISAVAAQESREEFNGGSLAAEWTTFKSPDASRISLDGRPGFLRLQGSTVTLADTEVAPVFLARKQNLTDFEATAALEFTPSKSNESAGIALRQNERHFYEFGIRKTGTVRELYLQYVIGSMRTIEKARPLPA